MPSLGKVASSNANLCQKYCFHVAMPHTCRDCPLYPKGHSQIHSNFPDTLLRQNSREHVLSSAKTPFALLSEMHLALLASPRLPLYHQLETQTNFLRLNLLCGLD